MNELKDQANCHSIYFELGPVLCLLIFVSANQPFSNFTDKTSWKSQWFWLFQMVLFQLLVSWYIFIVENFLLREHIWQKYRALGSGNYSKSVVVLGMKLRRVAVVDPGTESEEGQAHSSQREMLWQNENRTWLGDRNPPPGVFFLIEECSESFCRDCKRSTGENLIARNTCINISHWDLVPFLSTILSLLFNSNSYKMRQIHVKQKQFPWS